MDTDSKRPYTEILDAEYIAERQRLDAFKEAGIDVIDFKKKPSAISTIKDATAKGEHVIKTLARKVNSAVKAADDAAVKIGESVIKAQPMLKGFEQQNPFEQSNPFEQPNPFIQPAPKKAEQKESKKEQKKSRRIIIEIPDD